MAIVPNSRATEQEPTEKAVTALGRSPSESPGRIARIWTTKRQSFVPVLVVIGVILLGNAVYLLGLTDPDPLCPRSSLVASIEYGWLPGERTLDPNNGFVTQAIGREAARQIVHGDAPLWNPYQAVGFPLAASGQAAALFPPTLLNLLPNGLFFETLLLELVGGLATYCLMRRLGVVTCAAVVAGVAFGLNGTFAWIQNGAMLPVAVLPLLLVGVEQAVERANEGKRGGWITIAVALALSLLAGFLEVIYIYGLLVVLWTLWRFTTVRPEQRIRLARK